MKGLAKELTSILDSIDRAEEELREEVKERKDAIAALRHRAREVRDVISGKKGAQLPLASGEP